MRQSRWFLLALAFLTLNGYAVFHLLHNTAPQTVGVEMVSPERVGTGSLDALRWRFSAPMEPMAEPVVLSPRVDGTFVWEKPNELIFHPSEGWPGCTPFSATLSGELRSGKMQPLVAECIFTFRSTPLKLLRVAQTDYSGSQLRMDLEFNEKVSPKQLGSHLFIKTPSGAPISHYVRGSHNQKTISVQLRQAVTNKVVVKVRKGLQSIAGPLGLEDDAVHGVSLSRNLKLLHVSPRTTPFGESHVDIRFNLPVDLSTGKNLVKVEPDTEITLEALHGHYYRIWGDFEAGKNYVITFDGALKSTMGSSLGKTVSRTVYFPDTRPALQFTARGSYMSPGGGMSIPLRLVNAGNCTATIRRIYPNNLVQLVARKERRYNAFYGTPYQGISHVVGTVDLAVDAARNAIVERRLDLRPVLENQTGAFHVEVRSEKGACAAHYVVVSDTGISVRQSRTGLLIWANSLRTLAPLSGASVKIHTLENQILAQGKTDAAGIAGIDLPEGGDSQPFLVSVENGNDLTFLPMDSSQVTQFGCQGSRAFVSEGYEACLFTDRGIYRPGETTHLKMVIRDAESQCPEPFPVKLKVYRPDGKTDRIFDALPNEFGTAEFEIPWPDFSATGKYRMEAVVPGARKPIGKTVVAVEEFVPPQICADLEIPEARAMAGESIGFEIVAAHLFGRPAEGLPASARVDFAPVAFCPAQWAGFSFGDPRRRFQTVQRSLGRKKLDANGRAAFEVQAGGRWRPAAALKAVVSGTVLETGGRAVTVYGGRPVDVYPFYLGIRRPEQRMVANEPATFDFAAVRPDGSVETAATRAELTVEKVSWITVLKEQNGQYRYHSEQQAVRVMKCDVNLNAGTGSGAFTPAVPGQYRLSISVPDSSVCSSVDFHVGVRGQAWTERSLESPDVVELELDQERYLIGDTAVLSLKAPFAGKALLTIESDRILSHRIMELTNNTAEVAIPVEEAYGPNVYCSVSVLRPALPEETWGPHRASGRTALIVEQPEHRLDVELDVPEEIRPRTRLEIPVRVAASNGEACGAEVVVSAVDEGICMLSAFKTPDPFAFFFEPRLPAVLLHDLYAQLMPETTDRIDGTPSAPGGGMLAAIRRRLNPIKARRFKPVALWSTTVQTDTNGLAHVAFDVPEFTGQLRIMAVATGRTRHGSAERKLLVKRPLVVQGSLPRFLAPSDTFTLPMRIHNETGTDGWVEAAVSFAGKRHKRNVFLAANTATNIAFKLAAPPLPGKATCRLHARMGEEEYEENIELAVRPATGRSVHSGSGRVAPGKTATLAIPYHWLETTGEAVLYLSALPTVKLGGGIDYLMNYPYGCLEQTTSKSMPLLYLAELAAQSRPDWIGKGGVDEFIRAGIHRILSMQRSNGSFSLWPNDSSYDWGSIYATHFLVEAAAAGHDIPADRLDAALGYLEAMLRRQGLRGSSSRPIYPGEAGFGNEAASYNRSYACHVLALAKRPQHGEVARLLEQKKALCRGGQINLAAALLSAGKRRDAIGLLDAIGANPAAAPLREIAGSLRSEVRNDAVLLSALLDVDPEDARIAVLVRRLEAAQSNGRWCSTQDNAIALMALGKYCKLTAGGRSPMAGRVGTTVFANKEKLRIELQEGTASIQNTGHGPIHYCWISSGIPVDGQAGETDRGITLRRQLLALDGSPADPAALRQGELYIVKLALFSNGPLDNIVVEDLLPAGLEIENIRLKTAQIATWIQARQTLPVRHADARDDRMLVFTGSFSGAKTYHYAVRAVTEGRFAWPAVSATCMYDPGIASIHGKGSIKVTHD